jgi:phosphotriesterase-related protein
MTVNGLISADELGTSLIHEHLLVDFIGADSTGYHRWDRDSVTDIMLPYLNELDGVTTLFDCTPAFLGRDPLLLKALSDESGINIITNTGLYGARNNKYLPPYAFTESAEKLANRWINEYVHGIENTGIRPGFIKIGVDPDSLSGLHRKLITAAALTHRQTGLSIASHTGPAVPAHQQIKILRDMSIDPSAFIWVHAHTEKDTRVHVEAAKHGAWISLDGVNESSASEILMMVKNLRKNGLLRRVLLSHDAGWYTPGTPSGGTINGYTFIMNEFVPMLQNEGFNAAEIDTLLRINPQSALQID